VTNVRFFLKDCFFIGAPCKCCDAGCNFPTLWLVASMVATGCYGHTHSYAGHVICMDSGFSKFRASWDTQVMFEADVGRDSVVTATIKSTKNKFIEYSPVLTGKCLIILHTVWATACLAYG